jgi:hypothetical protein
MAELSTKSTKNEILKAYNDLMKKVETQKEDNPKAEKEKTEKNEIVQKASGHSVDKIIKEIASLKLEIAGSLDKVEDSLLTEFKKLREVQEAIAIEKKQLEDLYGISANADSFAAMILAQKEKKELFEREMAEKKESLENDLSKRKHQLEEEIEQKRAAWAKEKKEKEEERKEQEQDLKKSRVREEEEYAYNLTTKRKKEENEYNAKKSAQEKELGERKAAFEKEIKEREENILAREQEYKELKERASKFPAELETALKNKEAEITERLTTKYNFEKELQAKSVEGELRLKDQTIKTLDLKIKDMETLIKQLGQKADEASLNVKDIAIRAIDSSSKFQIYERQGPNKDARDSGRDKE